MNETHDSNNRFKPHNFIGWLWLIFASSILAPSLIMMFVSLTIEPKDFTGFFFGLTYTFLSLAIYMFYKISHLKQESIRNLSLALVAGILMGVSMYITNTI